MAENQEIGIYRPKKLQAYWVARIKASPCIQPGNKRLILAFFAECEEKEHLSTHRLNIYAPRLLIIGEKVCIA